MIELEAIETAARPILAGKQLIDRVWDLIQESGAKAFDKFEVSLPDNPVGNWNGEDFYFTCSVNSMMPMSSANILAFEDLLNSKARRNHIKPIRVRSEVRQGRPTLIVSLNVT